MDIYESSYEFGKITLKRKLVIALFTACTWFVIFFGYNILRYKGTMPFLEIGLFALGFAILSLVYGLLTAFFVFGKPIYKSITSRFLVYEDSITQVSEFHGKKTICRTRTIHKGKVRTIFEVNSDTAERPGIGISERRSRFAARFFGCVFIPSSLPKYEELKSLVESWKAVE